LQTLYAIIAGVNGPLWRPSRCFVGDTVMVGSRRAFEIQTEFPVIEVRKIGHATFETPDLEKAIAYYTLVNGLTLAGKDKGRAFLASKTGLLTVQLEQGQQARCTRLSFELAPDADFTAIRKQLFDEGIACEERRESSLGIPKLLSFSDPKGTVIELYSEWSYVGAQRDCVGIGPLKLGHVAFFVPDPNSIAQFYQRVLGFRVSDWLEDFFVFLRCNPDHHSINFLRGDRVRMHHIAFELRDVAHIANACDLLAASKIPLVWGPLRFGPGHNIAAFHRDHDGQLVEFYTELDQMKDETLGYFDPRPWHRDKPQRPKRWRLQDDPTWGPPPPADFM
jgi:catechol 2,3-dioxygenase-like lactoylglutathione lyase family enzyme